MYGCIEVNLLQHFGKVNRCIRERVDYTRNLLERKIKEELPQNKTDGSAGYQAVVNEYDKSGNLVETKEQIEYTYDTQNRLTERTAKEKKTGKETVHTYRYNAYGDVAVQDDTQFVYSDVSGQVTKETTKLTKNKDVIKNYTYDSNGNKSTFSVKAGEDTKLSLSYEYDGSSRLISVKDSEGKQAVSYAYDTEGSLSKRQAANGLKTTYGYDYQNRLTSMTNETGKGVVSKYSSTYLKNGQKEEEVSTVMDKNGKSTKKTAAYTYDMLGRITRETKTGREDISYTYDANNNRKQMTIGNKTTAYQYNKNDELLRTDTLHTDTEKNDVVIYKNDKNGNRLATVNRSEIPAEAKDTSYIDVDVTLGDNQLNDNVVNHHNALNQLTETLTKNYKVSFTYDAEGLRTGKTVNGEKTIYVWDGEQVVMELSKGGAVQKRYIRGNDLVYADKGENTEKTYYVTDMHGNVVQLLDESGNVTKTYEYDSFGNEVKPEKKDENPYRYCGEYYDKETEAVYLRARYYEPGVGRFITRDTYTGESDEPLSLHLYTYCENDGVNMVDPSGHKKIAVYKCFNVDYDGSPHAYAPKYLVINGKKTKVKNPAKPYDNVKNAKNGKKWVGVYVVPGTNTPVIRTEKIGPIIIGQYYVSTTTMEKTSPNSRDPEKIQKCYVNAATVPYLVVNNIHDIGKIFLVVRKKAGKIKKYSLAIGADYNHNIKYDTKSRKADGEGSLKLLQNLGKKDSSNGAYGADKGDKFHVYRFSKKLSFVHSEKQIIRRMRNNKKVSKILGKQY